eukprot:6174302-Pleurochrysis_carterae.AAC.1
MVLCKHALKEGTRQRYLQPASRGMARSAVHATCSGVSSYIALCHFLFVILAIAPAVCAAGHLAVAGSGARRRPALECRRRLGAAGLPDALAAAASPRAREALRALARRRAEHPVLRRHSEALLAATPPRPRARLHACSRARGLACSRMRLCSCAPVRLIACLRARV